MICINYKRIKKIAFIILGLPFICFAIGWLKWYWACMAVITVTLCIFLGVFYERDLFFTEKDRNKVKEDSEIFISVSYKVIFMLVFVTLIWVWHSGIGGVWAQSTDFRYRNAIFRDLVIREWPVIYPKTGHALVYYIGYWLFPAVIGKIFMLFGAGEEIAFNAADAALYVWTTAIIIIIFLLIINTLKLKSEKQQMFVILMFILFSGADIIGNIGYSLDFIKYHLEWWATDYQFSSFTTCLFWVFNQAVPAWLCFLCLLNEKSLKNYVFIGMMCLFNAPLPFVGWFVFCIFFAVKKGVDLYRLGNDKSKGKREYYTEESKNIHKEDSKEHGKEYGEGEKYKKTREKLKEYLMGIPSVSNILSTLCIFPVAGTYILSNAVIHGSGALRIAKAEVINESTEIPPEIQFSENPIVNYISFVCIEFALLMIFMAWKYKKSAVYYVTFASLLIIPLLKIGGKSDFSMRASIPALVMVFLLVCKFLIDEKAVLKLKGSLKRTTYILLVIFLLLGACTPAMEFIRGFHEVVEYGVGNEKYDDIYTLGCDGPYDEPDKNITYGNFVAIDLENQVFFKVFAKDYN